MSFKINKILTLFLITGCLFAQTISNVQARQKGLDIIITYDMAGKLKSGDEIKVEFSIDGGNNYISINNAVGDVGKNVTNGTGKEIFWQLLHSSIALENVKFKVIAKKAFPDISGNWFFQGAILTVVWTFEGDPGSDGTTGTFAQGIQMDTKISNQEHGRYEIDFSSKPWTLRHTIDKSGQSRISIFEFQDEKHLRVVTGENKKPKDWADGELMIYEKR